MKALIEKNTWSGIEEYYRHMGESCGLPVEDSEYSCFLVNKLIVVTGYIFPEFPSRSTCNSTYVLGLILLMLKLKWYFLTHVL